MKAAFTKRRSGLDAGSGASFSPAGGSRQRGLEEVQNALDDYSQEQERRDRLNQAAEHNQLAVDLATEQYTAGLVDFLSVLDAQRELYAAEDQAVQSQTTVTIDVITLYRALGGGWNAVPPVVANEIDTLKCGALEAHHERRTERNNESVRTEAVSGEHAHGAEEHDSDRRGHFGNGLHPT